MTSYSTCVFLAVDRLLLQRQLLLHHFALALHVLDLGLEPQVLVAHVVDEVLHFGLLLLVLEDLLHDLQVGVADGLAVLLFFGLSRLPKSPSRFFFLRSMSMR